MVNLVLYCWNLVLAWSDLFIYVDRWLFSRILSNTAKSGSKISQLRARKSLCWFYLCNTNKIRYFSHILILEDRLFSCGSYPADYSIDLKGYCCRQKLSRNRNQFSSRHKTWNYKNISNLFSIRSHYFYSSFSIL